MPHKKSVVKKLQDVKRLILNRVFQQQGLKAAKRLERAAKKP